MKKKIISGIMVTMFLVTMVLAAFPVQVSAPLGPPIKIGLIGPKGWIQWDGIKEGAQLAADLINAAGGMKDVNGTNHQVQFIEIDEHSVPVPDPTAAAQELLTALDTNTDMKLLIGGFLGESVLPLREVAMDYAAVHGRPIWIICGSSDEVIIDDGPDQDNPYDDVREDYERYKYMFRSDPMNDTHLALQVMSMVGQLVIPKLSALFGSPLPTYIVAEDLMWIEPILEELYANEALLGIDIVDVSRPSVIETDFGPILDAVEDSGAKLIIHFFAAVAGATFIRQWGERQIPAVPVGINVESMMQDFYEAVGGKCEYETIMSAVGTRTNINPDAEPLNTVEFWDEYVKQYGHAPIYTAWGAYLELMYLNETAAQWIGKTCDEIIPILEQMAVENTFLGYFKYTKYHDLYSDVFSLTPIWPPYGWPAPTVPVATVRAHIPQWQDGRMEVVWPRGYYPAPGSTAPGFLQDPTPLPFARKWKFPPWVYSLGETDIAGGGEALSPPMEVDGTPAGFFGKFPLPDGVVGPADMGSVTALWQQTVPWNNLEADMDGNQFIDIDDVARVALDWGKTA